MPKPRSPSPGIVLGYEAGSGTPVHVPLHHLVVTGTTQLAGKTTTLEALTSRSGLTCIAFRTKRGESSFSLPGVKTHEPFFRERADWQYVQGLLEATMQERMKFERSWIIEASKGAKTLRDVLHNVTEQLEGARGLSKSVLTNLRAYLEIVVPEIEHTPFARELKLKPGALNVMDLVGLREEVQALVIASTLEAVHEAARDTIVVLPEVWRFAPEGRGSPVKKSLEKVVRQGAASGVYAWLDSQDITGVDKRILKNVDNWLIGRQREVNEVARVLAQLPVPKTERPQPEVVMRLPLGHFIVACANDPVRTVYVQPSWLSGADAKAVALGQTRGREDSLPSAHAEIDEEEEPAMDYKRLYEESEKKRQDLEKRLAVLESKAVAPARVPRSEPAKAAEPEPAPRREQAGDRVRYEVDVEVGVPKLTVRERVVHVAATSDDNKGRLALLVAEGYFDEPRDHTSVIHEFRARGWGGWTGGAGKTNMAPHIDERGYILDTAAGPAGVPAARASAAKRSALGGASS